MTLLKKNIIFLVLLLTTISSGFSASNRATFTGKVIDENGEPLAFTNIILKGTHLGASTGKNGDFVLRAQPGTYTVLVHYIGYEHQTDQIILRVNEKLKRVYKMKPTYIEIGGIVVVADEEFIPLAPETKTRISSGEIEHMQAASLNDVMELAPGVETSNPTLNSPEKASIRGGDALGTQIVLDGIPVTNNANMQIGIGSSTANSGIDLRAIPAENIKEVEIIRGIPSARYGDLTDGLMIVKTKANADPLRIKMKYNPHLYEFNASQGFLLGDWTVNGNVNVALAEHDIRVEGDGYTRVAAQLTAERGNSNYDFQNIFYFTRAYDESKEKPGYALREAWYNRDVNLKYTTNYTRTFSPFSKLAAKFSGSYTRQNSFKQQLISRDNIVISDRVTEGSQEGRIVFGSYLGKKWIKGDVWNLYGDVNYHQIFNIGDVVNNVNLGLTWRSDFNKGEGIVFDPLFPPSLSSPTPRLRTYNDLPAYNIMSFYIEDKVAGQFWRPFTLQVGMRYEAYRPNGINIKGLWSDDDFVESHNGTFLNPRLNFSYSLGENTQLRLGYGMTSKSPPMGMIFAQEKYYDIVDTVSVVNPQYPDSNFSIISTHIRPQANPNLQGYTQSKYEASLDQRIGPMGVSITGYINNTKNSFQSYDNPTLFFKNSYPDWPNQTTSAPYDTLMDEYTQYGNNGWLNVRGVEVAFSTKRLPIINTVIKFDASYRYRESGTKDGISYGSRRYSTDLGFYVKPVHNTTERYSKDLLLNYRFDVQARTLGIWATLHVQQKVVEIDGYRGLSDTLAVGYFDQYGNIVMLTAGERGNPEYSALSKSIEYYELLEEDRPNKWLVNLKVSKSLWKGAEVSFYVNNLFYHRPLYQLQRRSSNSPSYERRNPDIFYGLEFSTILGDLF